jgi:hypothetical protein
MIIINMSEPKYKQRLRHYEPAFHEADWKALQAKMRPSVPLWQRPETRAAAVLLLLLLAGALGWALLPQQAAVAYEDRAHTPPRTQEARPAQAAASGAPILEGTNATAAETMNPDNTPTKTTINPASASRLPQASPAALGGREEGAPPPAVLTHAGPEAASTQGATALLPAAVPAVPIEATLALALVPRLAEAAGPSAPPSATQARKAKAVEPGERLWRVAAGLRPLPGLKASERLTLPMLYASHTRMLSKKVAIGAAADYYRYEHHYTLLQQYARSTQYRSASLSLRADYYAVVRERWAAYAGAHAGYRQYREATGWTANADEAFQLDPDLGAGGVSQEDLENAVQGKLVRQSTAFAGVHAGVQARLRRRLGVFAEVGIQPSAARIGLLWSYQ